jgi:uncharacterized membrane protein HdeD (DUF308 family)
MSSSTSWAGGPVTSAETNYRSEPHEGRTGGGWVAFSGIILIIAGLLNLVDGLWALDRSDSAAISDEVEDLLWYSHSLEVWGWFYIVAGALLVAAGIGVFSRRQWARWTGVLFATASIVINMMWVFVFPIAALIHVLLGTLVVYGLMVYGDREPTS